jgi:hypothetical protein
MTNIPKAVRERRPQFIVELMRNVGKTVICFRVFLRGND